MNDKKKLGNIGETYACRILRNKGYRIIKRNVYIAKGEIDIITRYKDMMVFVEVKSRSSDKFVDLLDSIDSAKSESLTLSCEEYLSRNNLDEISWRIDLIGLIIRRGKVLKVEHFKGII